VTPEDFVRLHATWNLFVAAVMDAAGALSAFLRAIDPDQIARRRPIEVHGITEADIRRVDGRDVVLWSGRRVDAFAEPVGRAW
jgi:hypothetical protein